MSEFTREKRIKATRRDHPCIGCAKPIPAGSEASYFAQKYDGEFMAAYYHTDCREAEIALNDLCDTWGEDWTCLCTIRDMDEPEGCCAWLREKFPVVADRVLGKEPTP